MTRWLPGGPSGAAVILAAVACTASPGPATATPSTPAASPVRTVAGTAASGPAAWLGPAADCAGAPLKSQLAAAVRDGASVIVAAGTLTGRSVAGDPAAAAAGAGAFYAMTLHSAQTLRGPAVAPGSTAWIPGPAPGTTANPENSALLAPGGRVFAVVWPKAATRALAGPVLQLAPVVAADVVFTPYTCWNLVGLQPDQYQASAPLRPVPGGANFGGTHQAAENGLYTLPLATVRQIAASA